MTAIRLLLADDHQLLRQSLRRAAEDRPDAVVSAGGVDLSGLERPQYPSLPTGLRFRYVSGPLWWSSAVGTFGPIVLTRFTPNSAVV